MKVKNVFLGLLFVNFQVCFAQQEVWFEGSLVLSTCEVLVGNISIQPEYDLVLFEQENSRTVYPAHKIRSLYFFDGDNNINRRYISRKEDDGVRSSHHLYEVVITGRVDVLRRKKESSFSNQAEPLDFNYFIRCNNEVTPLRKVRRKVYPQLRSDANGQLETFVASNKLRTSQPDNALRIIGYYNSLAEVDGPLARH
jgi:hypothetical protein